jgi:hypothetical protein
MLTNFAFVIEDFRSLTKRAESRNMKLFSNKNAFVIALISLGFLFEKF